jgi:uncharacterized protein
VIASSAPPTVWGPARVLTGIVVLVVAAVIEATAVSIFDPDLSSLGAKLSLQAVLAATLVAIAFVAPMPSGAVPAAALGLRRPSRPAVAAAVIAIVAYILAVWALSFVISPDQEDVAEDLGVHESTAGAVLAGLLIVVAAPVSEEVFFRGFMFGGLRTRIWWPLAAIISSVLWAALHLSTSNFAAAAQLAVFGMILAWLYQRTSSLYPTIAVHMLNNAVAFAYLASR